MSKREILCHQPCQNQGAISFHPRGVLTPPIWVAQNPLRSPAIRMLPSSKAESVTLNMDQGHSPTLSRLDILHDRQGRCPGCAQGVKASRYQTCPRHVATLGKEQNTCQMSDIHAICRPELALFGQDIETTGPEAEKPWGYCCRSGC